MSGYYIYDSTAPLGLEHLGTAGKSIWRDLKTDNGARRRARRLFGDKAFSLFAFTNFHDDRTFRLVSRHHGRSVR